MVFFLLFFFCCLSILSLSNLLVQEKQCVSVWGDWRKWTWKLVRFNFKLCFLASALTQVHNNAALCARVVLKNNSLIGTQLQLYRLNEFEYFLLSTTQAALQCPLSAQQTAAANTNKAFPLCLGLRVWMKQNKKKEVNLHIFLFSSVFTQAIMHMSTWTCLHSNESGSFPKPPDM